MTPLLKAHNLSFQFGKQALFKELSFEIFAKERVALTAPSGSGKSTLAFILAGHLAPQAGDIFLEGKKITSIPSRQIFLLHQDDDLFPWLKVEEQLRFVAPQCDTNKILQLLKLKGEEHKYPCQLSGGMKKRLALGRALAINPKLIILDEPFGFLDQKLKQELLEDLGEIWAKEMTTLLLISHDPQDVQNFCQREIKLTQNI